MMLIDRHERLLDKLKTQHERRERPKARRAHAAWVAHAQECPHCGQYLQARIRATSDSREEARRAHLEDPNEVTKGLFGRLGLNCNQLQGADDE